MEVANTPLSEGTKQKIRLRPINQFLKGRWKKKPDPDRNISEELTQRRLRRKQMELNRSQRNTLDISKVVGANINKYRVRAGLSQTELAEKLYVKQQAISNWESGKKALSMQYWEPMARELHIPLEALFSRDLGVGAAKLFQMVIEDEDYSFLFRNTEIRKEIERILTNGLLDVLRRD